jgi:DNA-binding SARP family transcriptional activator
VIEVKERTYRLRLRERDSIDAADFTQAARNALAEQGPGRRAALERAADLWTGEPLPEDRYAPWTFAWRERLAETYGHVLNALVETYGAAVSTTMRCAWRRPCSSSIRSTRAHTGS